MALEELLFLSIMVSDRDSEYSVTESFFFSGPLEKLLLHQFEEYFH